MSPAFSNGQRCTFPDGVTVVDVALYVYRSARCGGGGTVCQRWCGTYSDADSHRHAAGIRVQQRYDTGICHGSRFYCRYGQPAAYRVEPGEYSLGGLFGLGFTEYASVMVPVDIAAIIATLVMLHLFFRKDIPPTYDLALLKAPTKAIRSCYVPHRLDSFDSSVGRFFRPRAAWDSR